MNSVLLVAHLAAVLLAGLVLWSIRHEFTEMATTRLEWLIAPALAIATAAVLLYVSPGKRLELWIVAIAGGFVIGLGAGLLPKVNQDLGLKLVRVPRTWDGVGAATLLLLLALVRFVTSDLTGRQSGRFGVLGALAAFLAMYLVGRAITVLLYKAPRSTHLDMIRGQNPHRTLA